MKIIVGADVIPRKSNIAYFNEGKIEQFMGEPVLERWLKADFRIFNLEAPITDEQAPLQKHGSNFNIPVSSIKGIQQLAPSVVCLSNNHIKDHGVMGIDRTIDVLIEAGLSWTGIMNSDTDRHPHHILEKEGQRIGIYNCAENEFSIVGSDEKGAVPFDPLVSLDKLQELKKDCDAVIVLYHGGIEYYRYPSPQLQTVCRKMVEKGADLIICQHSHCVGSMEVYLDKQIIYGQGNFIFDSDTREDDEFFSTGMLVEAEWNNTGSFTLDYLPIKLANHKIVVADPKDNILEGFMERSKEITKESYVTMQYQKLAAEKLDFYLQEFAARNKWINRLDTYIFKGALLKRKFTAKKITQLTNYIECEAHREVLIKGLQDRKGEFHE